MNATRFHSCYTCDEIVTTVDAVIRSEQNYYADYVAHLGECGFRMLVLVLTGYVSIKVARNKNLGISPCRLAG
jgi:fructose-specific phosphotransferase system IIC component